MVTTVHPLFADVGSIPVALETSLSRGDRHKLVVELREIYTRNILSQTASGVNDGEAKHCVDLKSIKARYILGYKQG